MKILLVSSEVAPFAKTGGLADVAAALPMALAQQGIDARIVMPAYGTIEHGGAAPKLLLPNLDVTVGSTSHAASVSEGTLPGTSVPVYFIHNPFFFHRDGVYMENGRDYPDNARRFAFFCKAVIWMIKGLGWIPDVIHCNDWPTGPLPVLLKNDPDMILDKELQGIKTLFTIHNLAYQGVYPPEVAVDLGFTKAFHPAGVEFYGNLNYLKGGLMYSDVLTTVSPTYAQEIQTQEFGCGLEGVLKGRTEDLHGILNGIDYTQWNPETDAYLPAQYGVDDLAGKAACKAALQEELGLAVAPDTPLLVMISRLDPQKGLDIFLPLIDDLMKRDLQLAILGTGVPEYHALLERASARHGGQLAVRLKFDNGLAHRMEAGGDIFLMPSHYEPCGLNQLYSLRYGTVPVVRETGGLADSVEPLTQDGESGTGFVFQAYTGPALLKTIDAAVLAYGKAVLWEKVQRRGMMQDFSWDESARLYQGLYEAMVTEDLK